MTVLTQQLKLQRDSLTEGGFAGLREHRLVKSPRAFGLSANDDGSWSGIGNFVYLADARFMPQGETHMHSHHEVDVISVMVDGNIAHQGSMGHGKDLKVNDVQVQRAGGEGFSHNEVNPDDDWNRMIQLWVLPEQAGQAASYKVYQPKQGESTRIYGGFGEQDAFSSHTLIDVALLKKDDKIDFKGQFNAYIARGSGVANDEQITDGDMISGENLDFTALSDVQLIVIHTL
jgi:redox-sensitive bicupin YhaK (pirin superfamily)